jgi:phosphatidylglycerophosphate synthase
MKEDKITKQLKIINEDKGFSDPGFGKYYRELARPLAKYLVQKTEITANQVTIIGFFIGIFACILFLIGNYWISLIGVIILHLRVAFDLLDGMIARARNMTSDYGEWLDRILDRLLDPFLVSSLATSIYIYQPSKSLIVWPTDFFAILGMMLNSSFLPITIINFPHLDKNLKAGLEKNGLLRHFVFSRVNQYVLLTITLIINKPFWFILIVALYGNSFYFLSLIYFMIKLKRIK